MTRRDAGWMILQAAAAAGGSEFFSGWLNAAQTKAHTHGSGSSAPPDPHEWAGYKPRFFSPEDFRNLDAFTAILIPTDDTPGAREAFVAPFIDFVIHAAAEYAPEVQERWRKAMAWLRSQEFGNVTPEAQAALVERMSRGSGSAAFNLIKEMAVHAFYTSRVGLIDVLEYKGLAYLTEFPACTHPEHHRV
ncbi:MAG TPA: gluconate 2-dehydrogenase subunit 3 family protein [Bryobacteraceae bacterium]|nr:gluconate 2-dehydrogenase subunit 3 family protein [Bryobacteraceae bacterium]